jgi:nitrite reductase/ring-hydroxylating ferredoxin subunit
MTKIAETEKFAANGSYAVAIDGRSLLVIKHGDEYRAFENRCPHTGDTLDPMGGSVASEDGLLLECQRHAAQFIATTGECVGGPCLGESLTPVPVLVSQGALYLD